ncbi:hypothetical protein SALBM311S_06254 [Streptomyces alboniger]
MMKAYEAGIHRPEFGLFVLVRRSDGRAVGGLGFHSAPDEEGRAEIGYDLVPGARGNGYITEALHALAQWALARAEYGPCSRPSNVPTPPPRRWSHASGSGR